MSYGWFVYESKDPVPNQSDGRWFSIVTFAGTGVLLVLGALVLAGII